MKQGSPERPSPLTERLVSFFCDLAPERYEVEKFRWIEEISSEFSSHEPVSQWNFTIENDPSSSIPYLRDGAPELEILDWCKNAETSKLRKVTRAFPSQGEKKGGISFHITKGTDPSNNGSYQDLRALVARWLPVGINRFKISSFSSLTVVYVNHLGPTTAPAFYNPKRGMEIGRMLKIFGSAPPGYESITGPYAGKMGFHISREQGIKAEIQIDESLEPRGVRVELRLLKLKLGDDVDLATVLNELDDCHEKIMYLFSWLFTEDAQKEFKPI